MSNIRPIKRYEVLEINIPASTTGTIFQFPDQPQLRNAKIFAVDYLPATLVTASPNSGSALLSIADSKKCTVSFFEGDLERVKNLPLVYLQRATDGGVTIPNTQGMQQLFDGIVVSWTKSFIKFGSAPTGDVKACFGVTYLQPEDVILSR